MHSPGAAEPRLVEGDGAVTVGTAAVRDRLGQLNSGVRSRSDGGGGGSPANAAAGLAADGGALRIHVPIAALQGAAADAPTPLHLLDTPGPNEAGEEVMWYQVERLLHTVDVVVYLLDYGKLKTTEEAEMFKRLRAINPQLVKRLSTRLFFVVNKADQLAVSEGLNAQQTQQYVASLVTEQLGGLDTGFFLHPDQVMLISARDALLARTVLNATASEDAQKRFIRLAFGFGAPSITPEQIMAAAHGMLQESGILDLESRVLAHLYAHSAAVKLLATADDAVRLLQGMSNVAVSNKRALETGMAQLETQAVELRQKLAETLQQFDDVQEVASTMHAEVTDEIRQHLNAMRARLFENITLALEPPQRGGNPMAPPPQRGSAPLPANWRATRHKFLAVVASLSGGGGPVVRRHDEVQQLLAELHGELMSQVHADIAEFWHILEACCSSRHAELIRHINRQLESLSRRVEAGVSEALDVKLLPVNIAMQMPSPEEFHADLAQLIRRGIVPSQERHVQVRQEQYAQQVERPGQQGICRWGGYYEAQPRTRSYVEHVNVTVYKLQPTEMRDYFMGIINTAMDNTDRALSAFVRTYIQQQLGQAKQQLQAYSERYLSAMTCALETSHQGAAQKADALDQMTRYVAVIGALLETAVALQGQVGGLVPQVQEVLAYDDDGEEEEGDEVGQQGLGYAEPSSSLGAAVQGLSLNSAAAAAFGQVNGVAATAAASPHGKAPAAAGAATPLSSHAFVFDGEADDQHQLPDAPTRRLDFGGDADWTMIDNSLGGGAAAAQQQAGGPRQEYAI